MWNEKYHCRIIEVGMGGTEVECTFDSQAGIRYGVEDHVIEDVVVVEKGAEEEIEDEVVAEIEIGF